MKYFHLLFLLFSFNGLGQNSSVSQDCWVEYKSTAAPTSSDNCKLRLCPDGSICCLLPQEGEVYITQSGWQKLGTDRLQLYADSPVYFTILKWTESEMVIQSETDPKITIYLKRSDNSN